MTEDSTAKSATAPLAARLRQRLRSFEPLYLAFLGLLAIPSYVFDSLAVLEIFEIFYLAFLWPFVAPLLEAVLQRGTDADEATEPTDWIDMGHWSEYAVWLLSIPLTFLNPFVLAQDFRQWLGTLLALARHRGSVPEAGDDDRQVSYRLPFDGAWTVVNGSHSRDYSHSWFPLNQRYAYDFVITDAEGRTRPDGAAASVGNYYCYDEPVLAPADGVVIDTFDGDLEPSRAGGFSHPFKRDIRGNYVVVQHAPDEYSCLAHLVPGSVTVEPGERVERGQRVGRCGHSGNSSEPHLHFQLQDQPNFALATSRPIAFDDVALEWPGAEAPITEPHLGADGNDAGARDVALPGDLADGTYRARAFLTAGQRVAHVGHDADADRTGSHGIGERRSDHAVKAGASRRRPASVALGRVGFGACVGGVATIVASIFVSPLTVAGLLGVAAAAAPLAGIADRSAHDADARLEHRLETGGTAVGVAAVGAVVAWYGLADPAVGFGPRALGASAFLLGFLADAAAGEYDRRRLRESFHDVVSPTAA
ncbi:M23 family metallopeptidase [Halostagnicola kamekurae]|uniref:Peptidase family M23 n=1 Tax=Halostagnicola kamekurae TaxID=619731 RepID=A0A1I6RTP0_9EURY|nr:M23 family metallopeptidase [Halostagnicola kamekurae]SFS68089.1 Peptidase family M23 [Halostagnicola kamekurae]